MNITDVAAQFLDFVNKGKKVGFEISMDKQTIITLAIYLFLVCLGFAGIMLLGLWLIFK